MENTDKKINALKLEIENLKRKLFLSEQRCESLYHEFQFGLAIEAISEGFVVQDKNDKILEANQAAVDILGLSLNQLMGKDSFDPRWQALHEDGTPFQPTEHPSVITNKTGKPIDKVIMNINSGNNFRKTISINSRPIINNHKQTGVVTTFLDITSQKLTEIKLKESQERFELAMKASTDGLYDWNLITNEIYYSPGWKKMVGYKEHEIANDFSTWEKLADPRDISFTMKMINEVINKKRDRIEVEFKMKHKKGHWVDVLSRGEAVYNNKGKVIRIIGTHVDITERKKAEKILRETKEKFTNAFENSPIPISILNINTGERIDVNKAFCKSFGFTKKEYMNGSIYKNSLAVDKEEHKNSIDKLKAKKRILNFPLTLKTKTGDIRHFLISSSKLYSTNNDIFISSYIDITERVLAEKKLKESELKFYNAFENSPIPITILNFKTGQRIDFNNAFSKTYGFKKSEYLKDSFLTHSIAVNLNQNEEGVNKIRKEGYLHSFPYSLYTKSGEIRHTLVDATQLYLDNKDIFITSFVDITERQLAEDKLIESASYANTVLNSLNASIAVIDEFGKVLDVNDTWLNFSKSHGGMDKKIAYLDYNYLDVCQLDESDKDAKKIMDGIKDVLAGKIEEFRHEYPCNTPNDELWFLMRVIRMKGDKSKAVISHLNITERKITERALKSSEEKFRNLAETVQASIVIIDPNNDFKILFVNEYFQNVLGYTQQEALQLEALDIVHPEYKSELIERAFKRLAGEILEEPYELKIITKSGENKWASFSAIKIIYESKPAILTTAVDITARKLAELTIQKSAKEYRTTLSELLVGVVVHTSDTSIIFSNEEARRILGLTEEQLKGRTAIDPTWGFVYTDLNPMSLEDYPVNKVISTNKPLYDFTFGMKRPDRNYITWANVNAIPVFNEYNKLEKVIVNFVDVTQTKLAEEQLKNTFKQLQLAIDTAQLGTFNLDIDSGYLEWNEQQFEIFGITPDDFDNTMNGFRKRVHPEDLEYSDSRMSEIIKGTSVFSVPFRIIRPNGEIRHIDASGTPIFDDLGNIVKISGINRDITENKKAEQKLKDSEEKFSNSFYNSPTALSIVNVITGERFATNNAFNELFGFTAQEAVQINTRKNPSIANQMRLKEGNDLIAKQGYLKNFPIDMYTAKGDLRNILVSATQTISGENNLYIFSYQDLTEQIMAEKIIKVQDSEIFKAMIIAEEKERERYAKELHDGLGPILSTGMIYLHTLLDEDNKNNQKEYLKRTYSLLEEATESIREISNNLSPDIVRKFGIVQAVRSFIEKMKGVSDINFSIHSDTNKRFSETIESVIYRSIIELLNNTIKHADANNISISFKYSDNILKVSVQDNGKGFDYNYVKEQRKGFGLMNLESRIQKFGGIYNFQSSIGKGTKVNITIQTPCL